MEIKGIDVSVFQGDINWPEVAKNDVNFAMIRASYGTSGIDKMFSENMNNIKSTNINVGTYHYCYAKNPQEAVKEANHFIDTIKAYKFLYPLALDLEENFIGQLGKTAVAQIINSFLNTLKEQNYYPILYTNLSWLRAFIDTSLIGDTEIWLAQWAPNLTYTRNVTMWQYSESGSVPGISGAVDLNISYKDYPTIIRNLALNNTGDHTPNPEPNPTPSVKQYIVKKGDSLWGIAQKILGDGNKYREIIVLNGLTSDKIYPGQILNMPSDISNKEILYTVKNGDTLWEIAKRFLNNADDYKLIMESNGLTSNIIYPGQILRIPINSDELYIKYTVKSGDTLIGIATKFLGNEKRYKEIMQLNNLPNNIIYPGQILKLPPK